MRRDDWREALRACFAAVEARRFRYGRHDCARFAAGCLEAMLTQPPVLPDWQDARSAAAAIGGGTLLDAVRAAALRNTWPEIGPRFAMAGDLVYRADRNRFGGAVGILDLNGRQARFASERGLAVIPITRLTAAWRI
jgi:hypothetical protein